MAVQNGTVIAIYIDKEAAMAVCSQDARANFDDKGGCTGQSACSNNTRLREKSNDWSLF